MGCQGLRLLGMILDEMLAGPPTLHLGAEQRSVAAG